MFICEEVGCFASMRSKSKAMTSIIFVEHTFDEFECMCALRMVKTGLCDIRSQLNALCKYDGIKRYHHYNANKYTEKL